jgi:hypothetical protein
MIYTSYFSSKKYSKEKGVPISHWNKFWDGLVYPLLVPSESLLSWWKGLHKKEQYNIWFRDSYKKLETK